MKKFSKVVFEGIFGIIFFLIMVGILNIIAVYVSNPIFQSIVAFINENILFILLISVIIFLANIFEVFIFPFNLIYPIFNAIGGVLWVVFIFRVLNLVDSLVGTKLYVLLFPIYIILLIIVPIIVLIVGYVKVFTRLIPKPKKKKKKKKRKCVDWEDVSEEFRKALYNIGKTLEQRFKPKEGKK